MAAPKQRTKPATGPVAWMAGHAVSANLLMLVLLVGGFFFLVNIQKEVFPDFELDIVNVTVAYPGASPEEVERSVILPIEAELSPTDIIKVTLTTTDPSLVSRKSHTLEMCQKLLENFHLETYTKAGIFDNLPEIIQNPAHLARWQPTLTEIQLRALLETITRTGVERINHTGDDHIVLWNHNPLQNKFPITYQLAVNQIHSGHYNHPYHYEEASVPEFLIFHPPSQFGNNSWELKVRYGNILTVRIGSNPQL